MTTDIPKKPYSTIEELAKNNFTVGTKGRLLCSELKRSKNLWVLELAQSCQGSFSNGFERVKEDPKFAVGEGRAFLEYKLRETFTDE